MHPSARGFTVFSHKMPLFSWLVDVGYSARECAGGCTDKGVQWASWLLCYCRLLTGRVGQYCTNQFSECTSKNDEPSIGGTEMVHIYVHERLMQMGHSYRSQTYSSFWVCFHSLGTAKQLLSNSIKRTIIPNSINNLKTSPQIHYNNYVNKRTHYTYVHVVTENIDIDTVNRTYYYNALRVKNLYIQMSQISRCRHFAFCNLAKDRDVIHKYWYRYICDLIFAKSISTCKVCIRMLLKYGNRQNTQLLFLTMPVLLMAILERAPLGVLNDSTNHQ